jgi:hypothetical protein
MPRKVYETGHSSIEAFVKLFDISVWSVAGTKKPQTLQLTAHLLTLAVEMFYKNSNQRSVG